MRHSSTVSVAFASKEPAFTSEVAVPFLEASNLDYTVDFASIIRLEEVRQKARIFLKGAHHGQGEAAHHGQEEVGHHGQGEAGHHSQEEVGRDNQIEGYFVWRYSLEDEEAAHSWFLAFYYSSSC